MIGEAFRLRRKRRNLGVRDVESMIGVSTLQVRRYEYGNLHCTKNAALNKLNALNMKWVREEH